MESVPHGVEGEGGVDAFGGEVERAGVLEALHELPGVDDLRLIRRRNGGVLGMRRSIIFDHSLARARISGATRSLELFIINSSELRSWRSSQREPKEE